jgi:uncharacterized protein (DUF433 family)
MSFVGFDGVLEQTFETFVSAPGFGRRGIMTTVTDIGTLIIESPGICGGRARIAGTGVSIRRIAGWYRMGRSPEEIADQYGHLNLAQVHAALAYYHANRNQIDQELAEEEAEYDRLASVRNSEIAR